MRGSRIALALLTTALVAGTAAADPKPLDRAAEKLERAGVRLMGSDHLGEGASAVLGRVLPAVGTETGAGELAAAPSVLFGARAAAVDHLVDLARDLSSAAGAVTAWVAVWPDGDCVSPDAERVAKFLDHLPGPVVAYVHLGPGSIGDDGRLQVAGTGSSEAWPRLLERINVTSGLDLRLAEGQRPCSETLPFDAAGLPTLELMPAASASAGGADELAEFAARLARGLARLDGPPAYRKTETGSTAPERSSGTPFTGTVPDYTGTGGGLRLDGVLPGGPAEAAGLAEGDVIVEVDGHAIDTIHDYAARLDAMRIGVAVEVVYVRDGERRRTMLTPTVRE